MRTPPAVRGETKLVDLSTVKANAFNHNRQDAATYERLKASLLKHGVIRPLLVRRVGKGYECLNGEHTARAAKELGVEKILVQDLGEVPLREARRIAVVSQELHGSPDQALLDANLAALSEDYGAEELTELPALLDANLAALSEDYGAEESTELPYSHDEILEAVRRSQEESADKALGEVGARDAWETIECRVPATIYQLTIGALDAVVEVAPHVPVEIRRGLALEKFIADWRAGRQSEREAKSEAIEKARIA